MGDKQVADWYSRVIVVLLFFAMLALGVSFWFLDLSKKNNDLEAKQQSEITKNLPGRCRLKQLYEPFSQQKFISEYKKIIPGIENGCSLYRRYDGRIELDFPKVMTVYLSTQGVPLRFVFRPKYIVPDDSLLKAVNNIMSTVEDDGIGKGERVLLQVLAEQSKDSKEQKILSKLVLFSLEHYNSQIEKVGWNEEDFRKFYAVSEIDMGQEVSNGCKVNSPLTLWLGLLGVDKVEKLLGNSVVVIKRVLNHSDGYTDEQIF